MLSDGERRLAAAILIRAVRDARSGGPWAQDAREFLAGPWAARLAIGLGLNAKRLSAAGDGDPDLELELRRWRLEATRQFFRDNPDGTIRRAAELVGVTQAAIRKYLKEINDEGFGSAREGPLRGQRAGGRARLRAGGVLPFYPNCKDRASRCA